MPRNTHKTPQAISPARLQWIRPLRQERSHETLERLLDATETLIEEKGFDDVPVAEIARRAHSSVGAVYARFRDKDSILHALHDRFCEEAYATADAALDPGRWQGASIPQIVPELVGFLVRIFRSRAGLWRTLAVRIFDPAIRERSERLSRYVNEHLSRLLLDRRREIGHPDPEVACDFAYRQLAATLDPLVAGAGFDAGRIPLADDRITRELTRSFLSYLEVDP